MAVIKLCESLLFQTVFAVCLRLFAVFSCRKDKSVSLPGCELIGIEKCDIAPHLIALHIAHL